MLGSRCVIEYCQIMGKWYARQPINAGDGISDTAKVTGERLTIGVHSIFVQGLSIQYHLFCRFLLLLSY